MLFATFSCRRKIYIEERPICYFFSKTVLLISKIKKKKKISSSVRVTIDLIAHCSFLITIIIVISSFERETYCLLFFVCVSFLKHFSLITSALNTPLLYYIC